MTPKPAGYVLQAMRARLSEALIPPLEQLRALLDGLRPDARQLIDRGAEQLNRGSDSAAAMDNLALLGRVCRPEWIRDNIKSVPADARAAVLNALLLEPNLVPLLPDARKGEATALQALSDAVRRYEVTPDLGPVAAPKAADVDEGVPPAVLAGSDAAAHGSATERHEGDPADSANEEQPRASTAARSKPRNETKAEQLAALPKARFWSSRAAMVVELDRFEDPDRGCGGAGHAYTLRIEATRGSREGGYRWQDKVIFQLTQEEFPLFVAVVMGWRESFEATNHGPDRNKSLRVKNQPGQVLYFDLSEAKNGGAIPVAAGERFYLAMLCTEVLQRNSPHVGAQAALDVIRHTEAAALRWAGARE